MKSIVDSFHDAVLHSSIVSRTDLSGVITFVNQNFETISGYCKEELIGKSHNVINSGFHPREFWLGMWRKISRGEIWREEVCNRAKDGTLYWVDTFVYPSFNRQGELTEYFSIRNDITQRKLQKAELLKSEAQLKAILNSTTDLYFLVAPDLKLLAFNAMGEKAFLKMREQTIGQPAYEALFVQLFNLQDGSQERFKRALMGEEVEVEREIARLDGTKVWYFVRYLPAYDIEHKLVGVSISLTNIQTRKVHEKEILQKNKALLDIAWSQSHEMRRPVASILGLIQLMQKDKQLISDQEFMTHMKTMAEELDTQIKRNVKLTHEYEQNSVQKDALMDIVVHDLKRPLNHVKGLSALLEMSGGLNKEQIEYLRLIKTSAQAGLELIANFLDIRVIESEALLKCEQIELGGFISQLLGSFRQETAVKNISLQANTVEGTICTDKMYLSRIMDNLISNAIKFSPWNSFIALNITAMGDQVEISIKDQGPGFSDADKKDLYQKFKKLSARPTGGESSNGLGLAIVKILVSRLGGRIALKSEVGRGSEFVVTIPDKKNR